MSSNFTFDFQFFNAKGIYCHMKYTRTQEIQNYTDEINEI